MIVALAAVIVASFCIVPSSFAFSPDDSEPSSDSAKFGSVKDYVNEGRTSRTSYGQPPYTNPSATRYSYGAAPGPRPMPIEQLIAEGIVLGIITLQKPHHHRPIATLGQVWRASADPRATPKLICERDPEACATNCPALASY